jgi:hypothetical protein
MVNNTLFGCGDEAVRWRLQPGHNAVPLRTARNLFAGHLGNSENGIGFRAGPTCPKVDLHYRINGGLCQMRRIQSVSKAESTETRNGTFGPERALRCPLRAVVRGYRNPRRSMQNSKLPRIPTGTRINLPQHTARLVWFASLPVCNFRPTIPRTREGGPWVRCSLASRQISAPVPENHERKGPHALHCLKG